MFRVTKSQQSLLETEVLPQSGSYSWLKATCLVQILGQGPTGDLICGFALHDERRFVISG